MGKTWLREGGTGWEYAQRKGGRCDVGQENVQEKIDMREVDLYFLSHQQRRRWKGLGERELVPL